MPYKKSKKISRRRNKGGTKHRSKRFRKSKRKTKYHKKKSGGGLYEVFTENPLGRVFGFDAASQQKKREVAECKKAQDEIIKQAQEAKKNCGKTESSVSIPSSSTSSPYSDIPPMSKQPGYPSSPQQTQSTAAPPHREIEAGPPSGEEPDGPIGGKNSRKKKSKRKRRTKHH